MGSARRIGVGLVALAVAVAACGGDDDGGDGDGGSGSAAAGAPIRVGLVNLESSIASFPEARAGAEAAAAYVNDHGGIGGRPIEYVSCPVDVSPETMVDCANQFVEADVLFVQEAIAPGGGAALPILSGAGIPIVGHIPFDPQLEVAEEATYLGVASPNAAAAGLQFLADEGHESVTYFLTDLPESHTYAEEVMEPAAEAAGLTFRAVYTPTQPDWNVQVAAALADDPDVVGSPGTSEEACTGYIGALRSAGYEGEIVGAACSQFIEALGEQATGVLTFSDMWRPDDPSSAPDDVRADIEVYEEAMAADGHEDLTATLAYVYFSDTMTLASILGDLGPGDLDGDGIAAALGSAVGVDSFMGPEVTCDGTVWPGQRTCRNGVLVYEVDEEGRPRAVTDDFITAEPPTSAPAGGS